MDRLYERAKRLADIYEMEFVPIKALGEELGINPYVIYFWTQIGLLRGYSRVVRANGANIVELREGTDELPGHGEALEWIWVRWHEAYELVCDPLLVSATQEVIDVIPFYRHPERAITLLAHKFAVRLGLLPMEVVAKILGINVHHANMLTKRKCNTVKVGGRRYVVPDFKWLELLAERRVGLIAELPKTEWKPIEFLQHFIGRFAKLRRRAQGWLAPAEILCYTHEGKIGVLGSGRLESERDVESPLCADSEGISQAGEEERRDTSVSSEG